jgi:hypothetical protein
MSLLFVPLTDDQLREWATSGKLIGPETGYTVTEGLREAFDVADSEEAEQVALLVASIAGLAATGRRLVAVADGPAQPGHDADPDFGEVSVSALTYRSVTSLFADEPGLALVAAAAAATAGLPLAQAWEHPAVLDLLSGADLLWHGAGEWDSLIAG